MRRPVPLVLALVALLAGAPAALADASWTTWHGDAMRTGFDASSAPGTFAPTWTSGGLDGAIYASPLVYGGRVYVATENDTVYALDAATGTEVWHRHVGTPVPSGSLPCGDIRPTVGITSTPVIDPATNAIYAVADNWDGTNAQHLLVGLDLATGTPTFAPRNVDPSGAADTKALLQRAALNLDGGAVLIGYGGNAGDCGDYHGWLVGSSVEGSSPRQYQYMVPTNREGAIWAPGGPAVDATTGTIYVATGNGDSSTTYDHGDSVIELDSSLNEVGYFESPSWLNDNKRDLDLGSATPALLSGGLILQAGKNGDGYLVGTDLSGHPAPAFQGALCASFGGQAQAYGHVFVSCADGVRALSVTSSPPSFGILWHGPPDAKGPPIVSGGLVWDIAYDSGHLYGLDPETGAVRVDQAIPTPEHFATPAAADGRLFVATGSTVSAWTVGVVPAVTTTTSSSPPPPAATTPPKPGPPRHRPTPATCRAALRLPRRRHRHVVSVLARVDRGRTRRVRATRAGVVMVTTPRRGVVTVRLTVRWSDRRASVVAHRLRACRLVRPVARRR